MGFFLLRVLSFLLGMLEHPEPQENGNLPGDTQQQNLPSVKRKQGKSGGVNAHKTSPHNSRNQRLVPAIVVPGGAQAQKHNGIGGNGIKEGQKDMGNVQDGHHHKGQQRHKPYQGGGQRQNDVFVGGAPQRLFRYLGHCSLNGADVLRQGVHVPQQVIHLHAEKGGNLHQGQHVGDGVTSLPFGNRLVGIV